MDTAMEWDARFVARRIDSNLAKQDEASVQAARVADDAEALAEDAALEEMIHEESAVAERRHRS